MSRQRGSEIPGQEFLQAVDWVIHDALEHVAQIEFWIESVKLCGAEQAVDGRCAFAAGIGRQSIVPEFWHAKSLSRTRFIH
jgi:hypothetical protein